MREMEMTKSKIILHMWQKAIMIRQYVNMGQIMIKCTWNKSQHNKYAFDLPDPTQNYSDMFMDTGDNIGTGKTEQSGRGKSK